MGGASSMASFGAQQQDYAAKEQAYVQNIADAEGDNRADETNLTLREMQENASYSEKDHLALIEGAQKEASVRAAAATGNVQGISVQNIVNGIGADINTKRADLESNWANTATQLQSQKDTSVAQEMGRINQVADPYSPNPLGALAGAAGSIFTAAGKADSAGFFGQAASTSGLSTPAPVTVTDSGTSGIGRM